MLYVVGPLSISVHDSSNSLTKTIFSSSSSPRTQLSIGESITYHVSILIPSYEPVSSLVVTSSTVSSASSRGVLGLTSASVYRIGSSVVATSLRTVGSEGELSDAIGGDGVMDTAVFNFGRVETDSSYTDTSSVDSREIVLAITAYVLDEEVNEDGVLATVTARSSHDSTGNLARESLPAVNGGSGP